MGPGRFVGGMAAGGVVATHLLTFVLLAPDAHARQDLLARSGHRWFTAVGALGLGVLAATTARFCAGRLRAHAGAASGPAPFPVTATALRLAAVQAVGWVALEAAERLAHAGSHWHPRAFALGLVVQAVVACFAAVVLRALDRGMSAVARLFRPRPRPTWSPSLGFRLAPPARTITPAMLACASGVRGPPARS